MITRLGVKKKQIRQRCLAVFSQPRRRRGDDGSLRMSSARLNAWLRPEGKGQSSTLFKAFLNEMNFDEGVLLRCQASASTHGSEPVSIKKKALKQRVGIPFIGIRTTWAIHRLFPCLYFRAVVIKQPLVTTAARIPRTQREYTPVHCDHSALCLCPGPPHHMLRSVLSALSPLSHSYRRLWRRQSLGVRC